MLRNFFSCLVSRGKDETRLESDKSARQDSRCLDEIKVSLQADYSFLISNYGFQKIFERSIGQGGCFTVLQNELMRLRVSSGGRLGGYGWSVGDCDADLEFEATTGWLNVLSFVNSKLGGNELLPKTGLKPWEPIPAQLLRDKYSQVLLVHMPEIARLMRAHGRIDSIPERTIES